MLSLAVIWWDLSDERQKGLEHHWTEHFFNLLKRQSTADPDVLQQIPHLPILDAQYLPHSIDEIKKAISQMNLIKATGQGSILAEIYKA